MTFAEAVVKSLETGCVIQLAGDPFMWRAGNGNRLISVDRLGTKPDISIFAALGEWIEVDVKDLDARLLAVDEERLAQKKAWLVGLRHAAELMQQKKLEPHYFPEDVPDDLVDWYQCRARAFRDAEKILRDLIEQETMPSFAFAS